MSWGSKKVCVAVVVVVVVVVDVVVNRIRMIVPIPKQISTSTIRSVTGKRGGISSHHEK